MNKPEISLCMIVKDEELNLPRCLDSAREYVDEIIIVDTGSTDRTPEIARNYGAKVIRSLWSGDFSASRNLSLSHARGDWILWLDADEILVVRDGDKSPRVVSRLATCDAFSVPIRNFDFKGGFSFHHSVRFFRRLPGIHFEGKAHESVDASLLEKGARIAPAPFSIDHYGYAIPPSEMEKKLRRNLILLLAQLEEDSQNSSLHYFLALTYARLRDSGKGFYHLNAALDAGPRTPNLRCLILNLLAYLYLDRESYREAEKMARLSLDTLPVQNTAKLLLGIALFKQKRYREARSLLLSAYKFMCLPVEHRRTLITQEHSHDRADLLWAIIQCCDELGDLHGVSVFSRLYTRVKPNDPLGYAALGLSFLKLGRPKEAKLLFEKALGLGGPVAQIAPLLHVCGLEGKTV